MICQWVHGEPVNRDFCGKPVQPGSVYCPEHHKRCYFDYVRPAERKPKPTKIVHDTLRTDNTWEKDR